MQPGDTITPNDAQTETPVENTPVPIPLQPPQAPQQTMQDSSSWQYNAQEENVYQAPELPSIKPLSWTASEFIAHNKGASWFGLLGVGIAILLVAVFFLTKDIVATVMVGLAGVAFAVVSSRKPRVLQYTLDASGLQIGDKHYMYQEFRSFTIDESGPLPSLLLMSVRRFLPPITLFFDPNQADEIINALASYLPHEDRPSDPVDKLMSKIRF